MPFLFFGILGGLVWALSRNKSASDPVPTHALPPGLTGSVGPAHAYTYGGQKVHISSWPVQNGRQFAIAQLDGTNAWVSFWHTVKTKKRSLYRGYESAKGDVAKLVKALGITG